MSQYDPRPRDTFGTSPSDTLARDYATIAAESTVDERAEFLRKTYLHLAGAVAVFVVLVAAIQSMPGVESLVGSMIGGRWSWLVVLGLFLVVSYAAERMARSATSLGTQYAGLSLYVFAEAIIFTPLIYIALRLQENLASAAYPQGPPIVATAAGATLAIFAALTAVVLLTRKDFSFLRAALYLGGVIAIGLIVCSIVFQFELGIIFTYAMIAFASMWVLYSTSNVLHHYRTDQYVVASLSLFASLALLFWYILRLAMYLYAASED